MPFDIANITGYIGLLFDILSFQFDSRKAILGLQIIGGLFVASHFYLLGALTGSAMIFLVITRNLIFLQKRKKWGKSILWPIFFIAIGIVLSILTWQGIISILPLMGVVFGTIARWNNREKTIRMISVIPSLLWIPYNILSGSIPTIIGESFILSSNLIGILRFDILKSKKGRRKKRATIRAQENIHI